MMNPASARMLRAIQTIKIAYLSPGRGLKTRMINIPTASLGSAILRKAHVSTKMTQKAAVVIDFGLSDVARLVVLKATWKTEERTISNT